MDEDYLFLDRMKDAKLVDVHEVPYGSVTIYTLIINGIKYKVRYSYTAGHHKDYRVFDDLEVVELFYYGRI